jgi:hypothetical protein
MKKKEKLLAILSKNHVKLLESYLHDNHRNYIFLVMKKTKKEESIVQKDDFDLNQEDLLIDRVQLVIDYSNLQFDIWNDNIVIH